VILRRPIAALRPWVRHLWYADSGEALREPLERSLPTGRTHLALRLDGSHVRVREGVERGAWDGGEAVVGGVREAFHVKDTPGRTISVGVDFEPGGAFVVLGVPAGALALAHHRLEDLWGAGGAALVEEARAAKSPHEALDVVERALLSRCDPARAAHPAVAHGIARLGADPGALVRDVVAETGFSERFFSERFREAVGLAPKRWARVVRFQRAVALGARRRAGQTWAEIALLAGYADEAHLNREFKAMAGVTPGAFAPGDPAHANHLPIVGPVRR
jgi:AraC-like DNA-binding protein